MKLICPSCGTPLSEERVCSNNHRFIEADGVLMLLTESFRKRLQVFEMHLAKMRAKETVRRINDPAAFPELPFGAAIKNDGEWRLRQYDLAIINQLLSERPKQKILEIGAWNGWLSYRLTLQNHLVVAIDYFSDEFDGLKAQKFYPAQWPAIQMDIGDLSPLGAERFDLIIMNRCLQFFSDPPEYLLSAVKLLNPGGSIILTGVQCFPNPRKKIAQIALARKNFQESYGVDLFLNPTRGYLDWGDKKRLTGFGCRLMPYPQLFRNNLKARLLRFLPLNFYGVYERP